MQDAATHHGVALLRGGLLAPHGRTPPSPNRRPSLATLLIHSRRLISALPPPTHQPTNPPQSSRPQCKLCIEGLDHHCHWTGKCIGKRTIFYFHTFLVLLVSQIDRATPLRFPAAPPQLVTPTLSTTRTPHPCSPSMPRTAPRPHPPLNDTLQCIHICLVLVGTLYFVTSR